MRTLESPIERARALAQEGVLLTRSPPIWRSWPRALSTRPRITSLAWCASVWEVSTRPPRQSGAPFSLDKTVAQYHYDLGRVLRKLGDTNGAKSSLRMAVKLRPEVADAHNDLGHILQQEGDLAGAAPEYDEAIPLAPGFVEARNNRGIVARLQGDAAGALQHFYAALELRSDFGEAHANLATLRH